MKNSLLRVFTASLVILAAVSCSGPKKMVKNANLVQVNCNPEVLECVAGKINAQVSVEFPAKYFNAKCVLSAVPVIVYEGGEQALEPVMFQGEKVKSNYETVTKAGKKVTRDFTFTYEKGMEKAHLEIRMAVQKKNKTYNFKEPYKIADGTNTTYMLVKKCGALAYVPDSYQAIIRENEEAQILYLINSAVVRPSELKTADIKAFQEYLTNLKSDERRTLASTDVIAYASPDGKEDFNANLSQKREKTATEAFNKKVNTKKVGIDANVVPSYVEEDWDGFKELVEKSNMQDKDLVLRVLEMYSDPNVREREIKNMSEVFNVLKKDVLPQLRRARFVANVDFKNWTNEELLDKVQNDIESLDEESLLHVATLIDDNNQKVEIYKKAAAKFNSDRAQHNLAVAYLALNKLADAEKAFASVNTKDAYYFNTAGIIALRKDNVAAAKKAFGQSNIAEAAYNRGVVAILEGNYPQAVKELAGEGCFNEALANILVNNLSKAASILNGCKCCCPGVCYLKAIVAARQGKVLDAQKFIDEAKKDECLAKRAENDIEFAKIK